MPFVTHGVHLFVQVLSSQTEPQSNLEPGVQHLLWSQLVWRVIAFRALLEQQIEDDRNEEALNEDMNVHTCEMNKATQSLRSNHV